MPYTIWIEPHEARASEVGGDRIVSEHDLGTDPRTGKRKYHNKTIHGTKKKAENYLSHAIIDRDLGAFAVPSKVTVGELPEGHQAGYEINGKSIDWCTIVVNNTWSRSCAPSGWIKKPGESLVEVRVGTRHSHGGFVRGRSYGPSYGVRKSLPIGPPSLKNAQGQSGDCWSRDDTINPVPVVAKLR